MLTSANNPRPKSRPLINLLKGVHKFTTVGTLLNNLLDKLAYW